MPRVSPTLYVFFRIQERNVSDMTPKGPFESFIKFRLAWRNCSALFSKK